MRPQAVSSVATPVSGVPHRAGEKSVRIAHASTVATPVSGVPAQTEPQAPDTGAATTLRLPEEVRSFYHLHAVISAVILALCACLSPAARAQAPTPAPTPTNKPAASPAWWFEREVIRRTDPQNNSPAWPGDYPLTDDYSVINQGQLKNLAAKAYAELQAKLPATVWTQPAGTDLQTMIAGWSASTTADNYAVVNEGQLKTVAKKFYDVLATAGYVAGLSLPPPDWTTGAYPWTDITTDDDAYAAINTGQAKRLFSFNLTAPAGQLPAWWAFYYFPNQTAIDPAADPDGDGATNLQELQARTDPNDFFNGNLPNLVVVAGNDQSGPGGKMLQIPLTVEVSDSNTVLANAPITFQVLAGGGQVALSNSGENLLETQEVRTGTPDGRASVFLSPSGPAGTVVQVLASAVTGGQTQSVTFTATVANYQRPTIRLSEGYQLSSVTLGEAASFPVTIDDPDHRAVKVELFAAGTKVAESTTAPFTTGWTPSQSGRVAMVVRVVDADARFSVDAKMLHVAGPNVATVAHSPASGGMAVTFPAGTDTIASLPFHEPAVYAGRMGSVSGSGITAGSGAPWQPGRFAPGAVSYVLQILNGPLEGAEFPILGNTASTLQVDGLASGELPGPGTRFLIRPRWTVGKAVPESLFGNDGGKAPELKLPDLTGDGMDRPYARTLSWASGGWQEEGGSPASALLPNSWFVVRNNSAQPAIWMPIGDVSHASVRFPIGKELAGPQDTPLTLPRPGVFSPQVAGLMSGEVVQESPELGQPGDLLLGFSSRSGPIGRTPDLTLYRHEGKLVQLGNEAAAGDRSGEKILDGGTGWIIRRTGPPADLFNHAEHATP